MNNVRNLEFFVTDFMSVIAERFSESQKEMRDNPNDKFISGRALAYQEVYEIIQNRVEIYDIKLDDEDE